jgi:hypothetical protein
METRRNISRIERRGRRGRVNRRGVCACSRNARHYTDRDKDRPDHALQRACIGVWRERQDRGGVNGRKINLISLDDGFNPSKTVEQIRRLVEKEQVAFIFQSLGASNNAAIRQYLNDNKAPQLFVATGASTFSDPAFSLDDGVQCELSDRVENLRQAYPRHQARRQDRRALSE